MTSKQTQVFRTEEALSVVDTLKLALEALKSSNKLINGTGTKFGLAGAMDGYYSGCFDVEGNNKLLTDAITAIKEALAQPEQEPVAQPKQGYTTKRNVWTGNATHKCNVCGRDDFRSEHAAKFHKCEAVEEPEPHSQDKWLDIQLPDTTPPTQQSCSQRTAAEGEDTSRAWVGLTDDEIMVVLGDFPFYASEWLEDDYYRFARAIEAAHGIRPTDFKE